MKKSRGQYFTENEALQQFVFDAVRNKEELLEPSFGAGHLLKKFKQANPNYPMTCYELDDTIKPIVELNAHQKVIYGDFTQQKITKRFKTIIGNPPYVKQPKGNNLYIKFIEICFGLLEPNGEMIFIVPSDFIKLTSASALITKMTTQGSFTDFLFPHDEKLFEGASIDVLVFRYEKGLKGLKGLKGEEEKQTIVNGTQKYIHVSNGIITFSTNGKKGRPLSELFDVYVGLVSGRDEIYRVPIGNIQIMSDKDKVDTYIYTEKFPTENSAINAHLLTHKEELLERRIRNFHEGNWFEWGAPRNKKIMEEPKPCIYIRNMTRKKTVAFEGTVQYFSGTLLCLIPKVPTPLKETVEYFNSTDFQKDYMYAGRFKIGQKQLLNVFL